ncbi:ketol-acid reductoisomerase [Peptostreptococcus anaerobius]|uniref:Ketol-acid reductoisomerase (NADP(+)) n=1 Tax=Peptostreptococcus porci TaxID=2652282 RepID=A0A6N7XE03_9FIRM|nr:ketol-acid reductoisomerase [Peptostreptococcus porci]MDY4561921.1 ketol-acid reductoisomerase [Peptostreptococcus porci]MST61527.1 ketol-acid reductoisomerase [Peptostreptococcus porci]
MAKLFYDKDVNVESMLNSKVCVVGYGSQGHAHAQNLRDSGVNVCVALYEGSKSKEKAEKDGFEVFNVADGVKNSDVVVMLLPDEKQKAVYDKDVEPNLREGQTLVFAHGFNIHFGQIVPPDFVDVVMVAPKGPGHLVRSVFESGSGVPAVFAVHNNHSKNAEKFVLEYAKGIGATRAGVLETTFKEETETDLFGEQAVLCGGVNALMKAGFETLVAAGYQKEVAYFECLHEMKLVIDLLYAGGFEGMRYSISDTAEYGDYVSGARVIDDHVKASMRAVLDDIQNGKFAREWIAENENGRVNFNRFREEAKDSEVTQVGKELRSMMSFLNKK